MCSGYVQDRTPSSYLVKVFSRNCDFQVMDSIKLYLQAKGCVQQTVGSTGYHLGFVLVNGNWGSHPPSIHLCQGRETTDISQSLTPIGFGVM